MSSNRSLRVLIGFLGFFISSTVPAYDQPFVNLGQTSFLDGGPPAGPGFYIQNYFQYYSSGRFNDNHGDKLPLPDQDLDVLADALQVIYLSPQRVFGGPHWALIGILPYVFLDKIDDGLHNAVLAGKTGIGDLLVGGALQFDPIMGLCGPLFVHRLEADFIVPIGGAYNRHKAINPSSNFWSFNPYWAFTAWFTPKWSGSARINYLWNAKNNDPNVAFGPVETTQAGQAFFANVATEYALTETFRVGINGYVLTQFTDTKVDGNDVPGRRERVWAIGPGFLYSPSPQDGFFFNAYFEQGARNRPEGNNFIFRYVHHFA